MAKVIHQTVECCLPGECPYCKRTVDLRTNPICTSNVNSSKYYCDILDVKFRKVKTFPSFCPLEEEGSW